MIFQKRCLQTLRPRTNSHDSKNPYGASFVCRKTNFIFKKTKNPVQIQINCLPNFKSLNDVDKPSINNNQQKSDKTSLVDNLKFQPSNQISCSSFMKSYIDKLKKQRKRQHRKLINSHHNKQEAQRAFSGNRVGTANKDVFMAKQMNHIFVLERIPKKNNFDFMNTVSIVQQDASQYNFRGIQFPGNKSRIQWSEPSWANKDKIDKMIKQMRDSRNKIDDIEDLYCPQQSQKHQKIVPNNYNLPTLGQKSRQLRRTRTKQNNRATQVNFRVLQPWKQQNNVQEFSIQQYNVQNQDLS